MNSFPSILLPWKRWRGRERGEGVRDRVLWVLRPPLLFVCSASFFSAFFFCFFVPGLIVVPVSYFIFCKGKKIMEGPPNFRIFFVWRVDWTRNGTAVFFCVESEARVLLVLSEAFLCVGTKGGCHRLRCHFPRFRLRVSPCSSAFVSSLCGVHLTREIGKLTLLAHR